MKKTIIIVASVVALLGGIVWLGKAREVQEVKGASSESLTFAAVQRDVKNGSKLYDVRTASEYTAGHFEGAINWPLQDMQAGKLPDVAKNTKLYVYCHSGNRSGQATVILKTAAYTNVTDLHGVSNVESLGGKLLAN